MAGALLGSFVELNDIGVSVGRMHLVRKRIGVREQRTVGRFVLGTE